MDRLPFSAGACLSLLWAQCPAVGAPLVASPELSFLPEVPCQTPNQAFLFRCDTRCPFCFLGFAGSSPLGPFHFVCVLCSEFPLVRLCASSGTLRPLPWSCIFPVDSGGSGEKRMCSPHLTLLKLRPPSTPIHVSVRTGLGICRGVAGRDTDLLPLSVSPPNVICRKSVSTSDVG